MGTTHYMMRHSRADEVLRMDNPNVRMNDADAFNEANYRALPKRWLPKGRPWFAVWARDEEMRWRLVMDTRHPNHWETPQPHCEASSR